MENIKFLLYRFRDIIIFFLNKAFKIRSSSLIDAKWYLERRSPQDPIIVKSVVVGSKVW